MSSRSNEEVKISPHDPQPGIGDNGGPKLQKLTAQRKVDRVLEVFRMEDISAAQKVIAATFVCLADEDGVTPRVSAADLKKYAVVKSHKTVYSATQKLEDKKVVKPLPEEGKARRYMVLLQNEDIDAAIDEIDASTTNQRQDQSMAGVPANGTTQQMVPVPENGCGQMVPLPANGRTPLPANGGGPLPFAGRGLMQREREDPEREDAREEAGTTDSIKINGAAIHGPGFKIDFGAVDIASGMAGIDTQQGRQIAEICARDWAANGEKPRSPMAMVKRAIAMHRNHKQTDDARAEREAKSAPASKRERIRAFAEEAEAKIKAEKQRSHA